MECNVANCDARCISLLPIAITSCGRLLLDERNLSACVKSCATFEHPRIPHRNAFVGCVLLSTSCGDLLVRPRRISSGTIEG